MISNEYAQQKPTNQKALYAILCTLPFIVRQGLPLHRNHVNHDSGEFNSNFMQQINLCAQDVPVLNAWLQRSHVRFTSPMIQNEMLEIMATNVL